MEGLVDLKWTPGRKALECGNRTGEVRAGARARDGMARYNRWQDRSRSHSPSGGCLVQ